MAPTLQASLLSWLPQPGIDKLPFYDLLVNFESLLTVMFEFVFRGSVPIVQFLVENGALLNSTDSKGSTAVVFAAKMGHLSIVSLLMNYSWPTSGCQLETTAQEAMIISAREGHVDILDCLLNNELVKINDECPLSGETSLCAASASGRKDSCKLLLKKGADPSVKNKNGDLPLHLATINGHYEIVDLLMSSGVPVNQTDQQGRTALLVAANVGQVGVIELLLTRGADKKFKDSKVTFTQLAFLNRILRALIEGFFHPFKGNLKFLFIALGTKCSLLGSSWQQTQSCRFAYQARS